FVCSFICLSSCSSDDDGTPEEEMAQPEEEVLDFSLLVDSWQASDFVFENANTSLPDTNVLGLGATVTLEVNDNGAFTFTLMFEEPQGTVMNSGEFRIENNILQAKFENNANYNDLEAEIEEESLSLEGLGIFDFSGEGSNVPLRFRGRFFRD
ncbi:MAG: hypothetical protein AAF039_05220, partial [Bacteroidota bacterium]